MWRHPAKTQAALYYMREKRKARLNTPVSAAALLLASEANGLAIDFTKLSLAIKDTTTPANNYDSAPRGKLTYTSPSPKMCRQADGTLKFGAHNYGISSEDATAWTLQGTTASAVDTVRETNINSTHRAIVNLSGTVALASRFTLELKADGRDKIGIYFAGANSHLGVDLTLGIVGSIASGFGTVATNASITSLSDGWYKVEADLPAGVSTFETYFATAWTPGGAITASYVGDTTKGFKLRKAHLRARPSVSTYIATTASPAFELPYEYDAAGNALGVRVEEQRTNLFQRSQEFNTTWVQSNTSISADSTAAPDGNTTADTFTDAATNTTHFMYQIVSLTSGTTYAMSVFAKAKSDRYVALNWQGTANNFITAIFDVGAANTAATQTAVGSSSGTIVSTSQESFGNGWYRLTLVGSVGASGTPTIGLVTAATGNAISSVGNTSFLGSGTRDVYLWGAQIEAGSFATSYIPTTSATVTRARDNFSIAASLFPLSASVGSLYLHFKALALDVNAYGVALNDGTGNNEIAIQANDTDNPRAYVINGGVLQANVAGTLETLNPRKIAMSWAANSVLSSVDGVASAEDTSATIPTVTQMLIGDRAAGSRSLNGHVRTLSYLPRKRTQAENSAVTT